MIVIMKTNYMSLKPLKADSKGDPESGKFLLVKSGILVFGIRNVQRGIQNPILSWIPLHFGKLTDLKGISLDFQATLTL